MEYRTPFKASIAVLMSVAITGAGLGVMIWQAIDIFRPRVIIESGTGGSLIVLLLPLVPFLAGAWVCTLFLYGAPIARPATRRSGLHGLAQVLTLLVVTVGVWVGAYIYFGGTAYTQWVELIVRAAYIGAALDFGLILGPVLAVRLVATSRFIPPRIAIR